MRKVGEHCIIIEIPAQHQLNRQEHKVFPLVLNADAAVHPILSLQPRDADVKLSDHIVAVITKGHAKGGARVGIHGDWGLH